MIQIHHFGPGGVLFTIVPVFIFFVFIFVIGSILFRIVKGFGAWTENNNESEATDDATVVSKRAQVSGGQNSTFTRYYVTFELSGGERREFKMNGSEYGLLAEDDTGQLHYQGSRYLGFYRVVQAEKPPVETVRPGPANLVCNYCGSAIPGGSVKCVNCGWTWRPNAKDHAVS
jgi:Protein of unknown function (DUF2500)